MRVKITENQYKKIFLSGKYDKLILEQGVKILDDILDAINRNKNISSKYTTTSTAADALATVRRNFDADFPNEVLTKIEDSFNYGGLISDFDDFKIFLRSESLRSVDENQFKALMGIKNSLIKDSILNSFVKDDKIQRIIALYKKAESVNRTDITQQLKSKLLVYFNTESEVSEFLSKYKGSVIEKIENLTFNLDPQLKTFLSSIKDEQDFIKLKQDAENLLSNVKLEGLDLLKSPAEYDIFKQAKEKFKNLTSDEGEFKRFKDFIEQNKISVDELSKRLKQKNPSLFTKIFYTSKKIITNWKDGLSFLILIILTIALTYVGIVIYKFKSESDSNKKKDSEISQLIEKSIKEKTLTISFDSADKILNDSDFSNNISLINQGNFTIKSEVTEGDENLFKVKITPFYLFNTNLSEATFNFNKNSPEKLVFLSSSGDNNLKTSMQIESDNSGRTNWLNKNYFTLESLRIDKNKPFGWDETNKPENIEDYYVFEKDESTDSWYLKIVGEIPNFLIKPNMDSNVYLKHNGFNWFNAASTSYIKDVNGFRKFLLNEFGINYKSNSKKIKITQNGDDFSYTLPEDVNSGTMPKSGNYSYVTAYKNSIYGGDSAPLVDTFVKK